MMQPTLDSVLGRYPRLAIAVSGGVDSMTLAHAAHRLGVAELVMVHAISPAVPSRATERVRAHAAGSGWELRLVDAGEFDDPAYRANPVNRCYFCKTNLYGRIAKVTTAPIASGANLDDLSDYRPGLQAATEHAVLHPYIEAGMDKQAVRRLARQFGLDDLSELPAAPCLSSRVETGLAIRAEDLAFIDQMERLLLPQVPPGADLRCRITHDGVVIEASDKETERAEKLISTARDLCAVDGRIFAGLRPYRRGAAFLHSGR
jgi:pyridinium-3,5-biscarboxylic acid mononucleotide sulfurtransferase